ncbi:low-density lipoprotein receptor-related protein 6-like, partial [Myzus persicae]|uniref:low-density lipoprotein receptor-related protein 6-like n=1 Tax=Myzus persicae TaxID=13164 RepID=UPI000B935243
MVNRRTLGTAKTTFCSTSIMVASVAILWLAATGYAQKAVSSPCSNNNAGCQHMCSESKDIYDVLQYKCACNKGYLLAEDKHNCVLIDEILLYSQEHSIKSKVLNNVSGKYNESIRPVLTSSMRYVRFDFDAHDNYIYYTEVPEASVIYKIHINGNKGEETVLSRFERERVVDLSVDWVTKNLYYIDTNKGTLNVLSTRNVTNKR